jgi:hypothetical protein
LLQHLDILRMGSLPFLLIAEDLTPRRQSLCRATFCYVVLLFEELRCVNLAPVWQGSGSSKNGFGSGYSGGVASLVELSRFKKRLAK